MNKNNYQPIKLKRGEVMVYDFGDVKIHNYNTNDAMMDQVIIIERDGECIMIENPCFRGNIKELEKYLKNQKLEPMGKILAYHMAGGSFLSKVPAFSTAKADSYGHKGAGAAMVAGFGKTYDKDFDTELCQVNNLINIGKNHIGGVDFNLFETSEAFDIEMPGMGVLYTHMLGADEHSIVPSYEALEAMIIQLTKYLRRNYALILSSHHTPEDSNDIKVKIAYLRELGKVARTAKSADEFKAAMHIRYPGYAGPNYLDMTVGFLMNGRG